MIRTTPRPSPAARRASRWTAAAACALLVGAAGCNAPSLAHLSSSAPEAGHAYLPPPPIGPCDLDHRDHAVAVARSAAVKAFGEMDLGTSTASFSPRFGQPQMRGQPVPTPQYGWYVNFSVRTAIRDAYGGTVPLAAHLMGPAITGRSPPPQAPPSVSSPLPGRIAEDLPPSHVIGGGQPMMRPGMQQSSNGVEQRDARTLVSPMQPVSSHGDPRPTHADRAGARRGATLGSDSNMITGDLRLFVTVDGSALIL